MDITKGSVLIQIQNDYYLLDLKLITNNLILETNIEPTIQGPELGLSEDIQTNINLIRQRYHNPSLKIETYVSGQSNNQTVAILYDKDNGKRGIISIKILFTHANHHRLKQIFSILSKK